MTSSPSRTLPARRVASYRSQHRQREAIAMARPDPCRIASRMSPIAETRLRLGGQETSVSRKAVVPGRGERPYGLPGDNVIVGADCVSGHGQFSPNGNAIIAPPSNGV